MTSPHAAPDADAAPSPRQPGQTGLQAHHWTAYPPALQLAERAAAGKARVLEIGPGHVPFRLATEFVDWLPGPGLNGPVHCLDLNKDPLPFDDQSIDFVYCRHTLEDLHNPLHACAEIARVARAGYIETPSPLAETTRGTDTGAPPPPWRGYVHHRYLAWAEGQTLLFLPKLPLIEYLEFGREEQLAELLNDGPLFWNSYFCWNGKLRARLLQHERDFELRDHADGYGAQVLRGLRQSVAHNLRLGAGALKAA